MCRTLYIVGNGFDLYHGMPTAYKDFGSYIAIHNPELYNCITTYLLTGDHLWGDFELALANLDVNQVIEEYSALLGEPLSDEWSDSYNHDFQYEIDRLVAMLSSEMYKYFHEWIEQVLLENTIPKLVLDKSASFLTFNYTSTLEDLYDIHNEQILHIHGEVNNPRNPIVIGHNYVFNPNISFGQVTDDHDSRIIEAETRISQYFKSTIKPIGQVIADNAGFFTSLNLVEQICILGHSLSIVDYPYFQEIAKHIDIASVNWKFSYYDEKDKNVFREFAAKVGIDPCNTTVFKLEELSE